MKAVLYVAGAAGVGGLLLLGARRRSARGSAPASASDARHRPPENTSPPDEQHRQALAAVATETGHSLDSAEFAAAMDKRDPLRACRDEFHLPKTDGGDDM
eukprot:1035636-Prymnesium_polylepis.1